MNKTPRTDKAEPQIRFIKSGWVRSDFARELELELNTLKKKLDDSKFGAQCSVHELEYDRKTLIKENLELKEEIESLKTKIEEDAVRYCKNADFWKDKYEHLVKVIANNTLLKKLNSSI
ncbi:MAG: hypothetical protein EB127_11360 [Alphaproteobacteria bacterium]|nr:hypothetical protein [Alphaproteobacteria bacterium]